MAEKNYITFIDNAGRAIFSEVETETDVSLKVKNPVMITVQQQENGQMAVQLFPLFFQEFVSPGDDDVRNNFFTYPKSNIAVGSDFNIEPRIVEQYQRIVNPQLVAVDTPNSEGGEPEVIKLFDDE
jgi:hypothetical protein|tara:strand:- start:236 stop:613 length:378 start_codon:yes stop_codon:yes gene_type:complete